MSLVAFGLALVLGGAGCSLLVDTSGHDFSDGGENGPGENGGDGGTRNNGASGRDGAIDRDADDDGGSDSDAACSDDVSSGATPCTHGATCAELDCEPERACIMDADGARCACPTGKGWDVENHACVGCDSIPRCDDTGETGGLLVRSTHSASCLCETRRNYFYSARTATTLDCDADDDGFTNQDAVAASAASDPIERENARCEVRRVQAFVLQNEGGHAHTVDVTDDFPRGMPLYESARNDGADDATALPRYWLGQGRTIEAREVNSLTKACVSAGADFNDDGVPDVDEWSASALDPDRYGAAAELLAAYRKYVEFSYFLELHDGWFEAPTKKRNLAIFRIAEKTRAHDDDDSVAVRYPKHTPDYVERCLRHPDALYSGDALNTIGGDFAAYGDDAEMTHHSQFKCLRIMSESGYKQAQTTEGKAPQRVYRKDDALARLDADGNEHSYAWTVNDCYADDGAEAPPREGATVNPRFAHVRCDPTDAPMLDTVRWASVAYEAYDSPYKSVFERGGYLRGCSNECVEQLDRTPLATDCMHCDSGTQGEGTLTPDAAGTECDTDKVCDGSGTCGDCAPEALSCDPTADGARVCDANGKWLAPSACSGSDSACSAGVCTGCAGDARDCNELSSDGCETDIANGAPSSCGGCGATCSPQHITPQCAGGSCSGACDQGWADCNSDKRSDGCEFDVSDDFDHCGSCNGTCGQYDSHCQNSSCVACGSGFANCDYLIGNGCETDIYFDPSNCGACGSPCADPTDACIEGSCVQIGTPI